MISQHLVTEPIMDDDAAVSAALEDVSVSALMACVVQLTGDRSYLEGDVRPREWIYNEFQGGLSAGEQTQLRARARAVISDWRDRGCPTPPALPIPAIEEIMEWIACGPVPAEYRRMYLEEMDLSGANPRAVPVDPDVVADSDFSVVVIGCGESGLLAGLRLKEAGIPFTIIEKNDDVGGTWLENRYPGCRVDVASHYYSFSFGPTDQFSEYYAQRPELYRYFRRLLDEFQLADHVRWNCEVDRAVWDEAAAQWHVTYRSADGTRQTVSANAVISGVGILNRPKRPDIPGLAEFPGPVFHTAQWDESVVLEGKRVALIGAGASGFQLGPAIVDRVAELVVFQRTPQWMAPNPRYHAPVKPGERWAMRHLPAYAQWYRFMLMWQSSDKMLELVRIDPDWPDFPRTANATSAQRREILAQWIIDNVGDDPALLDRVLPQYPPLAKRMLQDNGSWLRCLRNAHCELVTDSIIEIDGNSVVTEGGRFEVDIIILATGFRATEVLWPMSIVGRDAVELAQVWDGKPSAYRGVSVPGFPNFFILGGPGVGLAHAGSIILINEFQMRYVGQALAQLLGGSRSIEPTARAYDLYHDAVQAELETLMWAHPSITHSWYRSADGKVYLLCPWRLVDYWELTGTLEPADHLVT